MKERLLPWAAIALAALAYPLAVIAGGLPRFPSPAECVHPPRAGQQLEAVFGRFDRRDGADALLKRVLTAGFTGSQVEPDGCGRLKVDVKGVPNAAVGESLVREAQKAGLRATLENAAP